MTHRIADDHINDEKDLLSQPDIITPVESDEEATHGNGCTPNAIERSGFRHFFFAGESATFDRSDILSIMDEDQIPEWAAIKLHDMQNADAPDEAQRQSMKGVSE